VDEGTAQFAESKTMLWWRKLQLNSPDGATRQRAIDELTILLEHRSLAHQYRAAALLATIGHPSAVQWALRSVTNRDSAESSVRLLEGIAGDFSHAIKTESLESIATLDDPLQRIETPPTTMGGRQHPGNWENYRAVNCSALRQKAEAELRRRAEAEAQWSEADEKQKRQPAAVVSVDRRTA
jgi:hypothetical protein